MRPVFVRWLAITPLTASQTLILHVGTAGHTETIADCTETPFFRFSIFATTQTRVLVEGCYQKAYVFGPPNNYETLIDYVVAASTLVTTYNLTGVYANNSGWVTLQRPFIRITLHEEEVSPQTELRFWAQAWG